MAKKYVEVVEFDPGIGREYVSSNYPGPGIYWIGRLQQSVIVSGSSCLCVPGPRMGVEIEAVSDGNAGDALAKALAVALHREAALALIQKS